MEQVLGPLQKSPTHEQQRNIGKLFNSTVIMGEHQASVTSMLTRLAEIVDPNLYLLILKTSMQPPHQINWPDNLVPKQFRPAPAVTTLAKLMKKP